MNNTLVYPISQNKFSSSLNSSSPREMKTRMKKVISLIKFSGMSLRFFWVLSFILIAGLLTFYIFQLTTLITTGYQIQNYQRKINDLVQGNKLLGINSVGINSLENIDLWAKEMDFEKIDKIYYIKALEHLAVTKIESK